MALFVEPTDASALHDELLGCMPSGSRHDVDVCPFCVEKAALKGGLNASGPSGPVPSGASSQPAPDQGGKRDLTTENTMLSQETHAALLEKALNDATSTTTAALATKTNEVADLAAKLAEAVAANEVLTADNARLNKDLDEAQVTIKTATDEVSALKADVASKEETARLSEIASARSTQVENLGLFPKEYVADKASKWAEMADEDWAERLEEWRGIKPAAVEGSTSTETASAMEGTSAELTTEPVVDTAASTPVPARRAALGLTS